MAKINERKLPVARIGFELPWKTVHDATGYCAVEMAVEEANLKGDLPCWLEIVNICDDRNPETARRVAAEFVKDPSLIGVVGPLNSPMAATNQDIYHAAGVAQLTSEASSPLLTSHGYQNFFRLVANDDYYGKVQARVAVNHLNAKRIAVLSDRSVWGGPIAEVFAEEAEKLGSKPVLIYWFDEPEKRFDFDQLVRSTIEAKPDLVYFAVYWNPAHILAHQLRYKRLEATFLGTDALKAYPYLEVPGLDKVKPYHTFPGADIRIDPAKKDFFVRFVSRYPHTLVNIQYAAEGYDCALLLIEALRRAGKPDREKVLKELRGIGRFEGISGPLQFDEKGDLMDPEIGLYQCEDGLRKYLGSVRDLLK